MTRSKPRTHSARILHTPLHGVEAVALSSSQNFPRHAHDQWGVGLMIAGAQKSWSGRGQVEAGPGDLIAVNPGEMHDGLAIGARTRVWRMLYFDPAAAQADGAFDALGDFEIAAPVFQDRAALDAFAAAFTALEDPQDKDACRLLAFEQAWTRLLGLIGTRHAARRARVSPRQPRLSKVLQRLDDAPESPCSLRELAALAGVSKFHFLRGFTKATGATPHAYLMQSRARRARKLIAAGWSLAAAAVDAGFCDQSHMTRAFIRHFGYSPSLCQIL